MVKIELVKRDFVWIGFVVVLLCVGLGYAYNSNSPSVMGHTAGEIDGFSDSNAKTLCPANKFLDGDGNCRTAAQIVSAAGLSISLTNCYWTGSANLNECAAGEVATGHKEAYYGDKIKCCKISVG